MNESTQESLPCPECGSETWLAHRHGDAVLPECNYLMCTECEWQGEPE
jgi:hypothetical protein